MSSLKLSASPPTERATNSSSVHVMRSADHLYKTARADPQSGRLPQARSSPTLNALSSYHTVIYERNSEQRACSFEVGGYQSIAYNRKSRSAFARAGIDPSCGQTRRSAGGAKAVDQI